MRTQIVAGVLLLLLASPVAAQRRGTGSPGASSGTPPPTNDGAHSTASESSTGSGHDLPILPRHGMLGAPGSAPDALGPSRLGAHDESSARRSYGEAAPGTGQAYSPWKSGDRVRSFSSADVRAARQQQAPDLEWADAGPGPTQPRPQDPPGTKAHQKQRRPTR